MEQRKVFAMKSEGSKFESDPNHCTVTVNCPALMILHYMDD